MNKILIFDERIREICNTFLRLTKNVLENAELYVFDFLLECLMYSEICLFT